MELDRRTVLQATGLVATAGLVAACSAGTETGAGDAAVSSESPDQEPEAAAENASGDDASGVEAGAGTGVAASDVPVGGGVILTEPAIVITQPTEGDLKAFTAICPHQGCLVSEVKDNVILCPCHGSLFSAEDGSVLQGPARTGLTSAGVAVDGGSVVIS